MCKMMEDMRKESLKEVAKRMLADGMLTLEKIAEYAGLSLDEVKKLKADKTFWLFWTNSKANIEQ